MKLQNRLSLAGAASAAALSFVLILGGCNGGSSTPGQANPDGGGPKTTDNGGTAPANTDAALRGRPAPTTKGPAITGNVIKIGLVASQNGSLVPWGKDCIQGAQLAVDEANAAGGVDGKKIQLIVEDSASDPAGGKSAAEKLVSEGVVGMLGEVSSGITQPMTQVSYDAGIPQIAVGATKTTITDYGSNIFRVCYTDDFQGPVMAKFAYETLKLRKVAIMTDEKQPYSQYLSRTFKEYYTKLGGTIVAEESYESAQTTFTGQISNIKEKNPEGIFLSGYFNEVGPIVKQCGQLGLQNVKYFGGDGWDSTEIIKSGYPTIVGGYFCNHYNSHETRPEVQTFLKNWLKKYPTPPGTTMGALGYDAAALMIDAIKRAKTKDASGITDAIEDTVNFPGVSGSITLKGMKGNPAKPALVVRVTDKDFVPAKTFQYNEIYGSGS